MKGGTCSNLIGILAQPQEPGEAFISGDHGGSSSRGDQGDGTTEAGPSQASSSPPEQEDAADGPTFKDRELELVNFELGIEAGEETGRSQLVDGIVTPAAFELRQPNASRSLLLSSRTEPCQP